MPDRLRRLATWAAASALVILFVAALGTVAIGPAAEARGRGHPGPGQAPSRPPSTCWRR